MALRKNIVFLLCLNISVGYCQRVAAYFDAPQILVDHEEEILKANSNHTLLCQGNKPLVWTVPEPEKEYQKEWTTFERESSLYESPHYNYSLRLTITNISYPFVGYYYCHYKNAAKDSPGESEKHYIFVDDETHLSVKDTSTEEYVQVRVLYGGVATLPCKPTSPDVIVTLTSVQNGPQPLDVLIKNDGISYMNHYDEKIGITTNNTIEFISNEFLSCVFTRNNLTEQIIVETIVETPISFLRIPNVWDTSYGHTVVGGNLTLKCSIKNPNAVTFEWETPNGPIDKTRMSSEQEYFDTNSTYSETLVISGATQRDNGIYTCKVFDYQDHRSNASIQIKILANRLVGLLHNIYTD